jgi:hypothetical protein
VLLPLDRVAVVEVLRVGVVLVVRVVEAVVLRVPVLLLPVEELLLRVDAVFVLRVGVAEVLRVVEAVLRLLVAVGRVTVALFPFPDALVL